MNSSRKMLTCIGDATSGRDAAARIGGERLSRAAGNAQARRGMTLIELLVTMTIMAIISAAVLGTAAAAINSGREKKTESLIAKIHTLLMERYASYETRRVDVRQSLINDIDAMNPTPVERGQMMADLRLLALRELIKYEMPDRWSDVTDPPIFLNDRPPLAKQYLLRSANATGENGPAECLYMTIMLATGDGEARSLFTKQDFNDTDDAGPDGAPEFVDGWGNPIQFLRFAPGYSIRSSLMSGDAQADHDPLDPYRRDMPNAMPSNLSRYPASFRNYVSGLKDNVPAFRLVPLVFSAGSEGIEDGEVDIFMSPNKNFSSYAADQPGMNPFFIDASLTNNALKLNMPNAYGFGMPDMADDVDGSKGYITNHLLEY